MSRYRVRRTEARKPNHWLGILLLVMAGGLFAMMALGAVLRRGESGRGAPRLEVDRSSVDLGDRRLGTTARAEFLLTNSGTGRLRFLQVPYVEIVEGC